MFKRKVSIGPKRNSETANTHSSNQRASDYVIKHKEREKFASMTMKIKMPCMQRICNKIPKRMLISYKSTWRKMWTFVPMILSVYNALIIPFEFSFGLSYEFLMINIYIN